MALSSYSKMYPDFVAGNQRRLINFCDNYIPLIQRDDSFLNIQMLKALHYHSMVILDDSAGEFRTQDVHISYSKHEPPAHKDVSKFVGDALHLIRKHWNDEETSSFSIMAYALWRINWIHPFEDGNGRTSRALTYIIHKAKFETNNLMNPLPYLIEKKEEDYQRILRATDETFNGDDEIDEAHLNPMAEFLFTILNENVKHEIEMNRLSDHDL